MGSDPYYPDIADRAANFAEAALLGTEPRRSIWTDRDCLVHLLAILSDGDRARKAALAKPKAFNDGNRFPRYKDGNWWDQYEESAQKLEEDPATYASLAADDIRTLVEGLRDLERKLGEVEGPNPTEVANAKDA